MKQQLSKVNQGGPYMRKYGTYCQYCQLGFSSEIEVPQLGSEPFQLGKSQLELITANRLYNIHCVHEERYGIMLQKIVMVRVKDGCVI